MIQVRHAGSLLIFLLHILPVNSGGATMALEVDLTKQRAFLLEDGVPVYSSAISSGKPNYPTATGSFTVLGKNFNHYSSLYGRIISSGGRVLRADATGFDPLPQGSHFVPAPMRYFLRFDGDCGLHAGYLPGYPASHGCVRLPTAAAKLFFEKMKVGDPIRISGKVPRAAAVTRP